LIVIDTSALIAIFRLEPEADSFIKAIAGASRCVMSALSALETAMVMSGRVGGPPSWELLDEFLAEGNIEIVAFDTEQAFLARAAFLRFGKGRHRAGLNLGDCAAFALAKAKDAPLLFKGEDFRHTDVRPAVPA